jgi:hypothetical protein
MFLRRYLGPTISVSMAVHENEIKGTHLYHDMVHRFWIKDVDLVLLDVSILAVFEVE